MSRPENVYAPNWYVSIISYSDFIKYHGEQGAKEAGLMRREGKEYILQPQDVVHFKFNV